MRSSHPCRSPSGESQVMPLPTFGRTRTCQAVWARVVVSTPTAFSLGLAATISAIGLVAIKARGAFDRKSFQGPVVRALPAVSAVVILALGIAMTVRALPGVA